MSDADTMLRAAAINALYSGKLPMCACCKGATVDLGFDIACDGCAEGKKVEKELRCASVVRHINRLAGI